MNEFKFFQYNYFYGKNHGLSDFFRFENNFLKTKNEVIEAIDKVIADAENVT